MIYPYPKVVQIGDKHYYILSEWEAAKGPFDSSEAAYDAMAAELQSRHGW